MLILTFQALTYYNIVLRISVETNQIPGWQKINPPSLGNGTKPIQILPMLVLNYAGRYRKRIRKDVLSSRIGGGLVERPAEHDTKSWSVHNNSRHSSVLYLMRRVWPIEAPMNKIENSIIINTCIIALAVQFKKNGSWNLTYRLWVIVETVIRQSFLVVYLPGFLSLGNSRVNSYSSSLLTKSFIPL